MMAREQTVLANDWLVAIDGDMQTDDASSEAASKDAARKQSKKQLILALYEQGLTEIERLAAEADTKPSYVASVLQAAGLLRGYYDLYTTTNHEQNAYSRFFRGVLSFKTAEAALDSVSRIDKLYKYFERIGDRAGQHHAEVLALTGRNRARWSGKPEAAEVFMKWLISH